MFDELLKQAMQEKGVTATGLSAMTGIGKSSISQYLSGKINPPDKKKEVIASALDLPLDYFQQAEITVKQDGLLTPKEAAKLLNKSKEFVYKGLQDGRFRWGDAVKMGSRWSYKIYPVKFTECTGIPV